MVNKFFCFFLLGLLSACCNCIIRSPQYLGQWQAVKSSERLAGHLKLESEDLYYAGTSSPFTIVDEQNGLLLKLRRPVAGATFIKLKTIVNQLDGQEVLSVELLKRSTSGLESLKSLIMSRL